jgi:hypothetical protein
MRLFKRAEPAPVIDPAGGDPKAQALRAALAARDWRTARDIFATAADSDERDWLVSVADDVEGVQDWIGEWIAAEPQSTLPVLIRGAHGVNWAWEARGGSYAKYTKDEQFREFFRRLKMAENCLDEVTDRDPGDATAWAHLVTSARGRQLPKDQAWERFNRVLAVSPYHVRAHEQMLQYLCAKWFGSDAEMFAFARERTAAAPPGSTLPNILVIAHVEKWLALPRGEDGAYITDPGVRADLVTAAQQSIFHPAFVKRPGWAARANVFALGLSMSGEYVAAAHAFDIIGDQVTEWPWYYRANGDEAKTFAATRKQTYARAGR